MPPDLVFLTQDELAERWRMSPRSLERWRGEGFGPAWIRLRGRVLYRIEDVVAFERARIEGLADRRGMEPPPEAIDRRTGP
jgi:hypothetical protein